MELVKLTETIIKELVSDPESVSVKEFPSENEDEITVQVMVASSDAGKVIAKGGNIAKAIRTVVQASSYINENKRVNINIDSY